jgi:hypothetical protein
MDTLSIGHCAFDVLLLVLAYAGWHRSFQLSREQEADSATWSATAEALKEELHKRTNKAAFTILEVLISMAVLLVGLLGVAALIPIGKSYMTRVDVCDRTGACGRAALADIRVRNLLDPGLLSYGADPGKRVQTNDVFRDSFILDPLAHCRGTANNIGPLRRYTIVACRETIPPSWTRLSEQEASIIFQWHDDLAFTNPRESTHLRNGDRPFPPAADAINGHYSLFITATPACAAPAQSISTFHVAVAACYRRNITSGFSVVDVSDCDGRTATVASMPDGIGEDRWVMMIGRRQSAWVLLWYKVAFAGRGMSPPTVTLIGADWDLDKPTKEYPICMAFDPSVRGVYQMTTRIDSNSLSDP